MGLAQLQLQLATVTAPISGVVSRLHVTPGTVAQPGAPVWGEILDLSEIDVRCDLTAQQAHAVMIGDGAVVKQPGNPDAGWKGRVVFVGVAADEQTGLVPVQVRLKDMGDHLRCYVEVHVQFGGKATHHDNGAMR